ncbi:hypothetical protein RHMOL_Rhmol09G0126900 [Rhododendron molle]|uniref:Uncharacterized protein n=1 Tax=Rhododendron molle TaxID=49168 RepID=A0ACC0MDT1_RHOML|nr:hypothetical protein RHMOL_Rhmol09G0126900 [Rhododendron molle]
MVEIRHSIPKISTNFYDLLIWYNYSHRGRIPFPLSPNSNRSVSTNCFSSLRHPSPSQIRPPSPSCIPIDFLRIPALVTRSLVALRRIHDGGVAVLAAIVAGKKTETPTRKPPSILLPSLPLRWSHIYR